MISSNSFLTSQVLQHTSLTNTIERIINKGAIISSIFHPSIILHLQPKQLTYNNKYQLNIDVKQLVLNKKITIFNKTLHKITHTETTHEMASGSILGTQYGKTIK